MQKRYWLRGGLILSITAVALLFGTFGGDLSNLVFYSVIPLLNLLLIPLVVLLVRFGLGSLSLALSFLLIPFSVFLVYFPVGAFLGLVYGKMTKNGHPIF